MLAVFTGILVVGLSSVGAVQDTRPMVIMGVKSATDAGDGRTLVEFENVSISGCVPSFYVDNDGALLPILMSSSLQAPYLTRVEASGCPRKVISAEPDVM